MSSLSVFATSSVPPGIRGAMNQWCLEVLPGIFIGRLTRRVRDHLWLNLSNALACEEGAYAALIEQSDTEQGFTITSIGQHPYETENFNGLTLIIQSHTRREPWDPLEGLPDPTW